MNNLLKWWGANTVYAFIRYDLTLFWQNPDEQGKQASPDTNEQIVSKQFALSCSSCSPSLCVNALGGWPPAKQVQSLWCFEGGVDIPVFLKQSNEKPKTAGQEPPDRLLCERLSLLSS